MKNAMKRAMEKHPTENVEQLRRQRQLRRKKFSLYLLLVLSTLAVFVTAIVLFDRDCNEYISPQIKRAIVEMGQLLPQLEQNEEALRDACGQVVKSWDTIFKSDEFSLSGEVASAEMSRIDASLDSLLRDTLSWTNRVTRLRIGRDGLVAVVSKGSNRIVAHPDAKQLGLKYFGLDEGGVNSANVVSADTINSQTTVDDVSVDLALFYPHWTLSRVFAGPEYYVQFMQQAMYGAILEYGDYYIVCGIPALEYLRTVIVNSLFVSFIFAMQMWLVARWACMVMDIRREGVTSMRHKLLSYSGMLVALFFFVVSYYLTLSAVANDLKTMAKHADSAVETLATYEDQRTKLDGFLDRFYTLQCSIAESMVSGAGVEGLTREDMQRFADAINVKYVFLFDREGKVTVTNAPFDHLQVSDDPEHPTYQLRKVMDGVRSVVLPPVEDEWLDEYIQFVAVSRRNESNLADGFVLIGIDPSLRDRLQNALKVDTVLDNMVIGLPEHAIAVDKETLEIADTTDIGAKGESIEELGITQDQLSEDFNGIVTIDGTEYLTGISSSSDYYLVPIVHRTNSAKILILALKLTLVALAAYLILVLLAMFRYHEIVIAPVTDAEPHGPAPDAEERHKPKVTWADEARNGQVGLTSVWLSEHEKVGVDERWNMHSEATKDLSPEQRSAKSVYNLLLAFCLVILVPTLFSNLRGDADPNNMSILAYVVSGRWQKGLNIFALTSCLYLLCAMFVFVVLLNGILYRISKVSTMRVETVCLLLKNAAKYVCVIAFVYYGLAQFGVDTQTLLASAGILSLMISLGAKDMVSDIIAGFFTIFEGTYKVGDYITVGTWYGLVTEIGLRTTKVAWQGETKIFANSSVRDIINGNGDPARKALIAPVPYDADLEEIEAILAEELPQMMGKIVGLAKPPQYEYVDSLGESSVNLCIAIYVEYTKRNAALRQLAREVKVMFDRRGIEIPFNQLVLHNGDLLRGDVDEEEGPAPEKDDGKRDEPVQSV